MGLREQQVEIKGAVAFFEGIVACFCGRFLVVVVGGWVLNGLIAMWLFLAWSGGLFKWFSGNWVLSMNLVRLMRWN